MEAEPLVSVIMPAYNAERHIQASINSLLNQTYTRWELLIVNDGSADNTEAVIRSFNDNRIRLFSQDNKGVSAARNTALAQMEGFFFTFLDADDVLPEDSLMIRVRFLLEHPEVDIVAGSVEFFNDKEITRTWHPLYKGDPLQAFIRINEAAFCNPGLFIRRKNDIQYRFKEGMTHVEDLLFFASIASQKPHQYDSLKEVVYQYRITGNSAMSNLKGLERGYWTFYQCVRQFPNAQSSSVLYLKLRIIRIMILSYLAVGKIVPALQVVPKIFK